MYITCLHGAPTWLSCRFSNTELYPHPRVLFLLWSWWTLAFTHPSIQLAAHDSRRACAPLGAQHSGEVSDSLSSQCGMWDVLPSISSALENTGSSTSYLHSPKTPSLNHIITFFPLEKPHSALCFLNFARGTPVESVSLR